MARAAFGDVTPKLAELTDDLLYGEIWQGSALSARDRSIATVAALVMLSRPEQLEFHIDLALDNGVTRDELVEIITHLAFYGGWPAGVSAASAARRAFAARVR
ncbi:carboxymuconolactone decarboxylase family protein [Sphingobium sp.]|uniref:carboxymuconolactone decarboxylase family protein n=1 Tax=Sphingobium sp. TaxID=1912891 RepID=UPI0028BD2945|nr:carboxymuconolactone decarboxylase family protein [Sphingobium sp.]